MSFSSMNAQDLGQRMKQDRHWLLVDVRTPAEFSAVHVNGAINIPTDQLSVEAVRQKSRSASDPVFVVCQSGGRSRKACQALTEAGLSVINVEGGTTACVAAGLPVIRRRGVIGIDRQVRIAAGSLVLLGVSLGFWVHPIGYALAAFIGGGLVFAGVTDTCGMAMVLAAMPWNKTKSMCKTRGAN
jgi:rhodanese-related sulfurtransferase